MFDCYLFESYGQNAEIASLQHMPVLTSLQMCAACVAHWQCTHQFVSNGEY